jgi:hypothetical protein
MTQTTAKLFDIPLVYKSIKSFGRLSTNVFKLLLIEIHCDSLLILNRIFSTKFLMNSFRIEYSDKCMISKFKNLVQNYSLIVIYLTSV